MSLYNYVEVPNTNLLCCICRAPFTDPITTLTCQHTFCRECITRALSHSTQCPVDRSPLSSTDLGPVNPIVRSLVDELVVECVYREEGCRHRVQRQLLAAHLKEECEFSESRQDSRESALVQQAQKESNAKKGTSEAETSENSTSFFEAASSESTSPGDEASISARTENTQSHNTSNSPRRVSHLTEQNIILQHRVDILEGTVQSLKKEMAVVRTVLTPWIQNAAAGSGYTPAAYTPSSSHWESPVRHEEDHANVARGYTEGPLNSTTNIDSIHLPREGERNSSSQDALISDHNDLASYFPSEDEVRVRRTLAPGHPQYSQTQRQRPPGVGHHHHHSVPSVPGMEGHPTLSPLGVGHPSTSLYASLGMYGSMLSPPSGPQYQLQTVSLAVPDLDTTSPTISTTLHGLHSNIVSVASSIDEIHRKSDLALALMGGGGTGAAIPGGGVVGEVLRLGEEVMGVRATVQGLRMQMHNLMMGNVGVGVAPGGGMNLGFAGRSQPPNANNPSGEEKGSTEGIQYQRPLYPAAPGITKL